MNKKYFLSVVVSLFMFIQLLGCSAVSTKEGEQNFIDADNPKIQYFGRFDFSNPKKVAFDWPGVHITARFEGTSLAVRLDDHKNEYAVIIDQHAPKILTTDSSSIYIIANGLDASVSHTITIHKRTETFIGKGIFEGFILDNGCGLLEPDKRPERKIEFIGNSITCGYGVEGDSATCHFSGDTENASMSYAAMVSRELNADYSLVAYSGRGVVRNYGDVNKTSKDPMPVLYERICFNDSLSRWDFTKWIPQVVVINLGTNDFSTQPYPDKDVFQGAYIKLIDRLRKQYPGVMVFCICGPMIGEPCLSYIKEVVQLEQKGKREKDVFFIPIDKSVMADTDWGCDSHPNVFGMQKMMNIIVPAIKLRMNW